MKKLLLIIAIILSFAFQDTDLEEGWNDGYINGYCYEREFCISPIVPLMPLPRLQDTSYTAMYNRGFLVGFQESRKSHMIYIID